MGRDSKYRYDRRWVCPDIPITDPAFEVRSGLVSDLPDYITPDAVDHMCLMGYISVGMSPKGETWRLTRRGVESRDFMLCRRGVVGIVTDWLCRLMGFRVSLRTTPSR